MPSRDQSNAGIFQDAVYTEMGASLVVGWTDGLTPTHLNIWCCNRQNESPHRGNRLSQAAPF